MLRKIYKMHQLFGTIKDHSCKECCHLKRYTYRDKSYRKCECYGISNSSATDWTCSYTACGLFNQPWEDGIEIYKCGIVKDVEKPLKGQISIFDLLKGEKL